MTQGFIVVTAIISVYIIIKCIQKLEENLSTQIDKRFEQITKRIEESKDDIERTDTLNESELREFLQMGFRAILDEMRGEKKDKKTKKSLANKK